ncbi:MAG TPA: hypothetical protein VF007_12920 [Stellaceae bacterium]
MAQRSLAFALGFAAWLLCGATPSRAADEPVATAPIPPLPRDRPAVVPLHSSPPVAAPAKPAPRTATKPQRAAPSDKRKRAETHHKKPDNAADARKSTKQHAGETGKRTEPRNSHTPGPEPRPARHETAASRDQLRPPTDYPPRRYYYRQEIEGPPFPPPWYDRGPPFAGMPYPRGPMRPW